MISILVLFILSICSLHIYGFSMFSGRKWLSTLSVARKRALDSIYVPNRAAQQALVTRGLRTASHTGFKGLLMKSVLLSHVCGGATNPTRRMMSTLNLSHAHQTVQIVRPTEVIKRALDERDYKAFTLDNGMRVLLVSDPKSSRSAAALDVHVGYFSDPSNLPGLAHFCEHMSFLGTKKYPGEEEFSSFLSSNGGSSNAYTDAEDTVYYFDVNAQHLEPALDRFSQFFAAPLFTESATARELNAIESEHAKNINNDGFRLHQLDRDSSNPAHPLNRFATGNKLTLETQSKQQGMDLRQELLNFHSTYYTANLMTLSVLGNQSLSELESYVTTHFSGISGRAGNRSADPEAKKTTGGASPSLGEGFVDPADPALRWWGKVEPFVRQSAASLLEAVPIAESRSLTLSWPVWLKTPQDRAHVRHTKPDYVLSHLIGHEGAGSLRSYLVKRGWVNYIQAYAGTEVSDCQVFDVHIDLTEDGHKHRMDVAAAVFAYLNLLRETKIGGEGANKDDFGVPQYLIDEFLTLSKVGFNYGEKSDPSSYVSALVANMQVFEPSKYIAGPGLFDAPDQAQIASYLSHLTPSAARLMVVAPEFKNHTSEVGRFYDTEYNKKTLPEETNKWEAIRASDFPELFIPAPNDLVPTNFDLVSEAKEALSTSPEEAKRVLDAPPVVIRDDAKWQIWHKLDKSFRQPKVYVVMSLAVPADAYDADFVVKSRLFANCFMDSVNEFMYVSRLAGLNMELDITSRGVQVIFSGFHDKMPLFAEKVCAALRSYNPDEATFERYKEQLLRELNNWSTQQPYAHASYYASLVSENMQYTVDEIISAAQRCDLDSQRAFLPEALARSFGKALVIGNVDAQGAERLVQVVQSTLPFEPLPVSERSVRRVAVVPPAASLSGSATLESVAVSVDGAGSAGVSGSTKLGGYRLAYPEPNHNDDNSAAIFYFQLPSRDPREYMYLQLLAEVLEQPFYGSLRTQQQLGYVVDAAVRNREAVYVLAMTAQSSIVDGAELSRRIEGFIAFEVPGIVGSLTDEEFGHFKQAIAVRRLEPDQRLTGQAGRFWGEICAVDAAAQGSAENHVTLPRFGRNELEVTAMESISLEDFKTFAHEFLSVNGAKRRLLVSQITTSKPANERAVGDAAKVVVADSDGEEEELSEGEAAAEPAQGHVLDVQYEDIAGREKDFVSAVPFM